MDIIDILRIINNNVVSAINEHDKEVVIMGKGIGYGAKEGESIESSKITKIFVIENRRDLEKLKEQLEKIPSEIFKITSDIVSYAESIMKIKLNQKIYISLADHIDFLVKNYKINKAYSNPLVFEIKHIYKSQFAVGQYAVRQIVRSYNLEIGDDEAGNIALHIVNATYSYNDGKSVKLLSLIQDMIKIINEHFNITELDFEDVYMGRLISHIKYLSILLIENSIKQDEDISTQNVNMVLSKQYEREYECAIKLKNYIYNNYKIKISNREILLLVLNLVDIKINLKER